MAIRSNSTSPNLPVDLLMVTHVGVAHLSILIETSGSLKEKRKVIKSVIERSRNRYNASVAEVADLDSPRSAEIAITCVSNSHAQTDRMLTEIIRFIESSLSDGYVDQVSTEIVPF